jgi:hypothetical protein
MRGRPLPRGGSLPPSPRAAEAVEEQAPGAARRWAVYGGGGARRGGAGARRRGVWKRDGGDVGRGLSARRALDEEEAGVSPP